MAPPEGTNGSATQVSNLPTPDQGGYHSPTAALGSWKICRAGPGVCCPDIWGLSRVGDIQMEPEVLSVSVSPLSQQAETLKKRLPWQLTFLPE